MKLGSLLFIAVTIIFMTLFEWPKINKNEKKEKAAYVVITSLGAILATLLIYYPNLPGVTQVVEAIFYKPLGKLLEK